MDCFFSSNSQVSATQSSDPLPSTPTRPQRSSIIIVSPLSAIPDSQTEACLDSRLQIHNRRWVLFDHDLAEVFMEWWKETEFGEKMAANDNPRFRNPNWLSKTRTAPAWAEFVQAAERTTGRPKLICRHCDEALEHPNNRNSGSSGITAHLNRETCKKAVRRRGQTRQRVQQTLKVT